MYKWDVQNSCSNENNPNAVVIDSDHNAILD